MASASRTAAIYRIGLSTRPAVRAARPDGHQSVSPAVGVRRAVGVRPAGRSARPSNPRQEIANAHVYEQHQINPHGVGWVNFFKVRVSIRTCVPNLGAVRRERFLRQIRGGVGQIFFKVRVSIRTYVPNLGAVCRERFLTIP